MIDFDVAREQILHRCRPLPAVTVPLKAAVGRYAARAVAARYPAPRFDQSAMDGYAVRLADVAAATGRAPVRLRIAGVLPAGAGRRPLLRAGTAWRVLTGGPLPRGAEAVVIQEECRVEDDTLLVNSVPLAGEYIRRRGEEYQRGAPLVAAGARITPPVVGLLAMQGSETLAVREAPRVSVIAIGDELTTPPAPLRPGRIYESNGPALAAALAMLGLTPARLRLVPDDEARIRAAVAAALRRSHVVITNAGVSVGDFDFVAGLTARLGIRRVFWRVAVKPGKPLLFGTWRGDSEVRASDRATLFFGIPGNPVSTLVSFNLLIKPALLALAGAARPVPPPVTAELTAAYRKRRGRRHFLRGQLDVTALPARVTPLAAQGSHMLGALAPADCLIEVPAETTRLRAGQAVTVWPLRWGE